MFLYCNAFALCAFDWLNQTTSLQNSKVQKEVIPPQLEYKPREKDAKFQIGVGSPQENACLSSNPLGSKHNGDGIEKEVSFVYCNFNKFLKNNPETMMSWLRILDEIPDSILCLLQNPREGVANIRQFVTEVGTSNDKATVDGKGGSDLNNRIHFISWEQNPFDHQQRSHSLCNAMLDSHPYNVSLFLPIFYYIWLCYTKSSVIHTLETGPYDSPRLTVCRCTNCHKIRRK